jgi:hypothetical protein
MEKKSDAVRRLVREGKMKEALQIAKGFRLGISQEQRDAMERGYEAMLYPSFYRQIGKSPDDLIRQGKEVLVQLYG